MQGCKDYGPGVFRAASQELCGFLLAKDALLDVLLMEEPYIPHGVSGGPPPPDSQVIHVLQEGDLPVDCGRFDLPGPLLLVALYQERGDVAEEPVAEEGQEVLEQAFISLPGALIGLGVVQVGLGEDVKAHVPALPDLIAPLQNLALSNCQGLLCHPLGRSYAFPDAAALKAVVYVVFTVFLKDGHMNKLSGRESFNKILKYFYITEFKISFYYIIPLSSYFNVLCITKFSQDRIIYFVKNHLSIEG